MGVGSPGKWKPGLRLIKQDLDGIIVGVLTFLIKRVGKLFKIIGCQCSKGSSFTATLLLILFCSSTSNAGCIRQSLANSDYCGAAGTRSASVPDVLIGDFRGACSNHDACYGFGGETIVSQMENKFQKSMIGASREEKAAFASEMKRLRAECDRSLLSDLLAACSRVNVFTRGECKKIATYYFGAVRLGARPAFDRAVSEAFTCRSK